MNSPILLPGVTNSIGATAITTSSARLNGEITSTGGQNPTVHIYWGDNDGGTDPASWDHDENLGILSAGTFYKDISGLELGSTYYYRCSASNSAGSSWTGSTVIFITNKYKTGSTVPGATNWKQYTSNSIYVDVDTSAAGFTATPFYFTSLGGNSNNWRTVGITSIYYSTPTGFRLYLQPLNGADFTPEYANSKGWYVQWLGVPTTDASAGQTTPGATNWKQYSSNSIYVDVDTSAAGFTANPFYFTSLGGNSNNWRAVGITSIYYSTPTGFRLYLQPLNGADFTPEYANSKGWYVQWLGVPTADASAGQTTPGATNWKQYSSNSIYVDVDTSAAGFSAIPFYFTSLGGNSDNWRAVGITSIYYSTPTGFRLYLQPLNGADFAPEYANSNGWYVQWLGVA